ncbi:MAG: hypothetical protein PS018_20260 [bacterium]|nr:hypothetical protein [bacterium]
MTLPANIRVNAAAPFPAQVKGAGLIVISKTNGVWTVQTNFAALAKTPIVADPANTYVLAWNAITNAVSMVPISTIASAAKITKVLTGVGVYASPYAALPTDDVLIVKQAVGAPFTITVDWSQRVNPLMIADGKGDAEVNKITVTPSVGQSQLAVVNYSCIIESNGGNIRLTPLPDGSGAY